MTSKALEAAHAELARLGYNVPHVKLAMAFRAFAQNISEEAAAECEVEWWGCHYQCGGAETATPAKILRAIEKDLE